MQGLKVSQCESPGHRSHKIFSAGLQLSIVVRDYHSCTLFAATLRDFKWAVYSLVLHQKSRGVLSTDAPQAGAVYNGSAHAHDLS